MSAAELKPTKKSLLDRLPVSSHIRQSVGLQRTMLLIGVVLCTVFVVAAIFAPLLAPYGYAEQNLDISFQGPSWAHPLGTDRNGRDLLSRVIFASRTTAIITIATVSTGSILLPLTLGMLAGYRGGWVDSLIMR
ncbi:MAG: ABC transporter permease, partial [Actinomycetota bacterium]|nr:ABC transporter permease [Actinomycetota bacterium]